VVHGGISKPPWATAVGYCSTATVVTHDINFLIPKMTSNEKTLNYKVVDLVEIYKFCIKFISI
jgi:hypothetical protein